MTTTTTTEYVTMRWAEASVAEGRNFLFLHGLCGDACNRSRFFRPMPDGNATLWRVADMAVGHRRYERFVDRRFAEDAAAFLETRLTGRPPVIGGISMGAAIALRLDRTTPASCGGLVLARPAWVDQAAPPNLEPHRRSHALISAA